MSNNSASGKKLRPMSFALRLVTSTFVEIFPGSLLSSLIGLLSRITSLSPSSPSLSIKNTWSLSSIPARSF
ncbi:hypothetical protein [Anaerococcus tetradius]|uniref:hypothetical protein n=1 Tax=Anaerococcus tetradius TaxID=33036 RepID=UPI0023EFF89A|nr:hypothetical protein [Anaerococcus tetradius]